MPNENRPGEDRQDDAGKGARPGSQNQNTGSRGPDTGSDVADVTGQPNKPGIGQPGRGGDDLSGHGTHRSDTREAEGGRRPGGEPAGSQSGQHGSGDVSSRNTNTGRGQQNAPGRSPGDGSDPASRQHAGGQPRSTGEETLGGNQGAM